jgi:hypothetical protein
MMDFEKEITALYLAALKEADQSINQRSETGSLLKLSPTKRQEVLDQFVKSHDKQQSTAEYMGGAMGDQANPGISHARGTYTYLTEHLGDLLNRMTQKHCERINFGYELVHSKVERAYKIVTDGYGFDKEVNEAIKTNYNFEKPSVTPEQWLSQFDAARMKYVEAHKAIPVYNHAQWLCRQAAIDLGLRKTEPLKLTLLGLKKLLVDPITWCDEASLVTLKADGSLQTYRQ